MKKKSKLLTRLISLALFGMLTASSAISQDFSGSGDPELDSIRQDVMENPTNRENFKLRALKMKLWVATLQQQGARLHEFVRIDDGMRSEIWWNNTEGPGMDGTPQTFSDKQMEQRRFVPFFITQDMKRQIICQFVFFQIRFRFCQCPELSFQAYQHIQVFINAALAYA